MLRWLAILGTLLVSSVLYGQKEASIWYFGLKAGLDFRNGDPTILLDGQTTTMEGVASIADDNGNLLFYTNGTVVWNRQHTVMPNGNNLAGHFSSSQSAVVVPKINDPGRFYIFTVDAIGGPNGFQYSILNMSLDGGRGDVETKNIPLESSVCEKLTAVKHCNGTDVWVLVHRFNSADILAFLVTASGVNPVPVVSAPGIFIPSTQTNYSVGCMKVSPDGSKLALANFKHGAEVFDFNNLTGVVSGGGSLFLPGVFYQNPEGAYGVEFSPNSKFLYVSGDYTKDTAYANFVFQYDVTGPNIDSIRSSKRIVAWKPALPGQYPSFGALQMGPNGKLYLAQVGIRFLSVIDYPNRKDTACRFNFRSLDLQRTSTFGLPTFVQSNFRGNFTNRGQCKGQPIFFDYDRSRNELSVKWDYGDPASGANNFSTQDSSSHTYQAAGTYTVKLIRYTVCDSDTLVRTVNIEKSEVNLGTDSLVCGANQFLITPQVFGINNYYSWQDGSTNSTYSAAQSGTYWVDVINLDNGCKTRDSVNLTFHPYPDFSLGNDLDKCEGDVIDLNVSLPNATYLWNTGSTNNSIRITQQGRYWLEVNTNGCGKRDTASINFHPVPLINLGRDTLLCETNNFFLDAHNPGMQYQWENGSTSQQHQVAAPGLYWVEVNNQGCTRKDSIQVNFIYKPGFELNDTSICPGLTVALVPSIKKGKDLSYSWNTGSNNNSIRVSQQGNYQLTVSNQCGSSTKNITVGPGRCELYLPSAFTPNGDGLNDMFVGLFGEGVVEYSMQIFNRWGNLLFSTTDKRKGWDGRYKGLLQDGGSFVWIVRYKTAVDPIEKVMKRMVILVR